MIILRPVEARDMLTLSRLSQVMQEGLTTLPRRPVDLERRIAHSITSFGSEEVEEPVYLFVLEDLESQTLIGTSQIIADTLGSTLGFYYREEPYLQSANRLQEQVSISFLRPIRHLEKVTELGGLFLHPAARQKGLSQLLSLGRLLFMAAYPNKFKKQVIAEMRGITDEEGKHCPFWDAIGRKFLNISFDELVRQIALDPLFIQDIIPPFPICLSLLSSKIQQIAGKAHPQSAVAMQRLVAQGFRYTKEMDIFDGGPKISTEFTSLAIVQEHKAARAVCSLASEMTGDFVLLANHHPHFRACSATISIQTPETILIAPETAKALEINTGELVHYVHLHRHAGGRS